MLIAAIIMASLIGILSGQRKGYISQQARAEAEESVTRVHGELMDRIRMAGYMIPDGYNAITPYSATSGPDSIKIVGNYDNFTSLTFLNTPKYSENFFAKDAPNFKYTPGMRVMLISPLAEEVDTCWATVDTFIKFMFSGSKFIYFTLQDSLDRYMPKESRVSSFNEYTYKVAYDINGTDTLRYFGVRYNNDSNIIRLVENIDDIQITYETRIDTTDMDTFSPDSMDFIYAVNLDVQSRSSIKDREYTDSIYNDNYRRSRLNTQAVILNIALDKR